MCKMTKYTFVIALCLFSTNGFAQEKGYNTSSRLTEYGAEGLYDGTFRVTGAAQAGKWFELVGQSTPTTPAANHARFFYNQPVEQLCVIYDNGTSGCFGTVGTSITGVTAGLGLTGGGTSGTVSVGLSTPIANASIDSSSVTKQGNSFNSASQLLQLNASALVANANVDGSSVTKQANTFNGNTQLVQTNSSGQLPALSGVNLTALTAANISAGTLGTSVIASSVAVAKVGVAQLNFSGTASASTYARGDGAWASIGAAILVQSTCTKTTTASNTTSTSFQSTAVTAAITPTSASNKILIIASSNGEMASTSLGAFGQFTLFRGSTDLGNSDTLSGIKICYNEISSVTNDTGCDGDIIYFDSPATTSATTYTVKERAATASTTIYYPRVSGNPSTMCLFELAI